MCLYKDQKLMVYIIQAFDSHQDEALPLIK